MALAAYVLSDQIRFFFVAGPHTPVEIFAVLVSLSNI